MRLKFVAMRKIVSVVFPTFIKVYKILCHDDSIRGIVVSLRFKQVCRKLVMSLPQDSSISSFDCLQLDFCIRVISIEPSNYIYELIVMYLTNQDRIISVFYCDISLKIFGFIVKAIYPSYIPYNLN